MDWDCGEVEVLQAKDILLDVGILGSPSLQKANLGQQHSLLSFPEGLVLTVRC